jgi:hypothetical protein
LGRHDQRLQKLRDDREQDEEIDVGQVVVADVAEVEGSRLAQKDRSDDPVETTRTTTGTMTCGAIFRTMRRMDISLGR